MKKSLISIIFFMCIILTGCGNKYISEGEETSETEDVSNEADASENIYDLAKDSEIVEAWYYNIANDFFISSVVDTIRYGTSSNELEELICNTYDKLKIDEKSDLARDYLDLYVYAKCDLEVDINFDNLDSIFVDGYNEEDNSTHEEDNFTDRTIVVQIDNNLESGFKDCYIYKVAQGRYGQYVWYDHTIEKMTIDNCNIPMKPVSVEKVSNLLTENEELLSLMVNIYDTIEYELEELEIETAPSPKDPAIGMSKDEIINSTWGEPNDINVDEYEWGTEEQWVYDGKGYIYFENGIVDAIQHR